MRVRYGILVLVVSTYWGLAVVDNANALPNSVTRWRPVVTRYFDKYAVKFKHRHIRKSEVEHALAIIYRESRGYLRARNGRYIGLFQLDIAHFRGRYPWTAVSQCATAAMLWVRRGWQPWSTGY